MLTCADSSRILLWMSEWCGITVKNAPGRNEPGTCRLQRICAGRVSDNGMTNGQCLLQEFPAGDTVTVPLPKGEFPGIAEIQAAREAASQFAEACDKANTPTRRSDIITAR